MIAEGQIEVSQKGIRMNKGNYYSLVPVGKWSKARGCGQSLWSGFGQLAVLACPSRLSIPFKSRSLAIVHLSIGFRHDAETQPGLLAITALLPQGIT